ncbi:hypothetical protein A2761_02800 [Candidatus Kaiserbacteria bacterium RIFCSPHIGHO2_01_FULL_51_33]|uniref:Glycosyl transferase family 1 domain-containing protein n=1 Tax=Candidatus Kaiserbacteria bacterium RIFCSPLOWO2_01_FULL_51_21 TaxID=1798508 RepID=A0A1F6EE40_9BACT|nr:MAG: hypothetical protein A2761_02800 [Candidatus Kaiserbacteria bacterium RIFCSPHIGHO2_01_FULL_51_33]OGG71918.1 MAG: hypothetical protein A3A35_02375 [Candidatus Kaiserbacteria bacterium RIFCSPLOWO2_01_FULL_51_21]
MRLLICTQKVDQNDAVLGFMHGWIAEFARHCEAVMVICLEEREHHLPKNVTVFSLGKESLRLRLKLTYVLNFYRALWRLRGGYDAVFVHMNPEYMLLGGMFWRFAGIPAALWYNHKTGGLRARLGIALARQVFYTSPFAFASRFKKAKRMPAGIDTEQFKPEIAKREPRAILSLGRIDPVKKVEVLIGALQTLADRGASFVAHFYGAPTSDENYFKQIQHTAEGLVKRGFLRWFPAVPNNRAAAVYNEHALFVSATGTGSFDKAVLEAMACGVPALSCNASFRGLVPEELLFREADSADLAEKLAELLSKSSEELRHLGASLREAVIREQSLSLLVPRVLSALQ